MLTITDTHQAHTCMAYGIVELISVGIEEKKETRVEKWVRMGGH